jgi:hypothetical protein
MQSSGDGVDCERNGRDLLRAFGPMLANRPYRCELKVPVLDFGEHKRRLEPRLRWRSRG